MRLHNYAETCKGVWSSGLWYNFLIQLSTLKSLVFVVHCLNAFWHGNETFPKGSSQNEIVPLLVVFHLPYSKYNGVKICLYLCRYQNQKSSLVSFVQHSCRTRVVSVALLSHLFCTRVTGVSLMLHSCRSCCTCIARVWHSCCKLYQVQI